MGVGTIRTSVFRLGAFELDLSSGELREDGVRVKLSPQPFKVLALLVSRPGELVTRKEIQQQIWGSETFVDFEEGLNFCIKQIRTALGDDAETPRYIETLPRHGYRFIAPVEELGPAQAGEALAVPAPRARVRRVWVGALAGAALLAVLVGLNVGGWRERFFGTSPKPIRSLAVLPLENLSGDPEQDYFAEGMTEALITELGKISALRVISRQSAMQFKGTDKSLPEIARELNVDAIVEGAVVREGNRVRVTAQLVQASPERHLWSETYERDLRSILALQGEVARKIAREIRIGVAPEEEARLAGARPVNPEVYEAYLKGRYHLNKWGTEDCEKAIEYFQKAIEADPNHALSYVGLTTAYGWLTLHGRLRPNESGPRINAAIKKALEIDDTLPEVHFGLANIAFYHDWEWTRAEEEYKRTIELNSSFAQAHSWYSWYLAVMGRFAEAIAEAKLGVQLDPVSVGENWILGDVYYWARQYDQAIAQWQQTVELEPNDGRARGTLARVYWQVGRYEEAVRGRQKLMALRGESPEDVAAYGHAFEIGGIQGVRQWVLERLKEMSNRADVRSFDFARVYVELGENDQAIEWLEKGYELHDSRMVRLKVSPAFDSLRSDPRFRSLLRRMNFPE